MYILSNLMLEPNTDFENPEAIVSRFLKCSLTNVKLHKKSVDARKRGKPMYCCSFTFDTDYKDILSINNVTEYTKEEYKFIENTNIKSDAKRPVIVGFGPAGMFAALTLIKAGIKPIIFEKGKPVEERKADVDEFFTNSILNVNSNVSFGEGGAGTFSDGKLNTGIKDRRVNAVLKEFYRFGADKNILTDAKPHIGTDILEKVVSNIRNEILKCGGEIHFNSDVSYINSENGIVTVKLADGKEYITDNLILAIGNAARNTFKMLYNNGFNMEKKPFSIGVRIEHKQKDIDLSLLGSYGTMPPADYKAAVHLKDGRGVYTFCMCPGGKVINSASEENTVVTNGMSNSLRNDINANSALLVSILPSDIPGDNPLNGIEFQRKIEKSAYKLTGSYSAPFMTVGEFLNSEKSSNKVLPTIMPRPKNIDFTSIFPSFVIKALKEAIPLIDKKIKGFADPNAILTAPETRSSSPIRITRDETMQSNKKGVYPVGEGAGYAGGITSSAVDGIKAAEKIIENMQI